MTTAHKFCDTCGAEAVRTPHPPGPPYTPYTRPPKAPFETARGDLIFTLICAVLGFLFTRFALGGLGMGAGAFTLILVFATFFWLRVNKIKLSAVWPWFVLLLLSAVYFAVYDNNTLKVLILLMNVLIWTWLAASASGSRVDGKTGRYIIMDGFDALFRTPFSHMGTLFGVVSAGYKKHKPKKNVFFLLLGLAIALPVVLILGAVLSSADAVFEAFWIKLTQGFWNEAGIIIGQLILSVPVTLYLFGTLYGNRHHRNSKRREKEESDRHLESIRRIPMILLLGIIFPALLLYIVFFITQTAYILPFFQGLITPERLEISKYARRGFYELCGVSGFNLFLWAMLRVFGQKWEKQILPRVVGVSLAVVSLGMLVIALRKMFLNIGINGLTLPRVYTTAFMVLLGLIFIFVLLRLFMPAFPLEKSVASLILVLLLGLSFSNPNRWVAQYNVSAYEAGRLSYLNVGVMWNELGYSAVPALIRIISNEEIDTEYRNDAAHILTKEWYRIYYSKRSGIYSSNTWKTTNISRIMYENMIMQNQHIIKGKYQDRTGWQEELTHAPNHTPSIP
jgi:hypothetical protein